MESEVDKKKPLFRDLAADDELEASQIESLCMACGETGITRLLITRIPMFKEVVVMSFSCPHCHNSNNEIQSGAMIQDGGVRYSLCVPNTEYLKNLVVKSDTAAVRIPELDFEVPPSTQKGVVTTLEGVIAEAISGLGQEQPARKAADPETARKIDEFIEKLQDCLNGKRQFTFVVDDPSGNSFIENKMAPLPDPNCTVEHYKRTEEQNSVIGLCVDESVELSEAPPPTDVLEPPKDEVLMFPTSCHNCLSPTQTRMKIVDIPHFKQVIIMATVCDSCGYRTNEVKSGTGVSPKGTKITLRLTDQSDLSRDILKSETASLEIPEIQLELHTGTLGGKFTTIEGLLQSVSDQLKELHPFSMGDSHEQTKSNMATFLGQLDEVINGKKLGIHIIMDDPAGNSYLQNVYAPDPDPELTVEHYERTYDQNDVLGLNEMKVENYETTE